MYILRNGSHRPKYATVSEYQYLSVPNATSLVPKLEISPQLVENAKSRASVTVAWSVLAVITRGLFAITRGLKLAANPVVVVTVVILGAIAALASFESVNYASRWALRVAGFNGLADTLYVSQLVITNIWFWHFLFCMGVWQVIGFLFFHTSVFERTPTAKVQPADTPPIPQTKKTRVSEASSKVSSRGSGEEDPWTVSPHLNTCYAGWLLLEGGYDKPLGRLGCKKPASFITPVSSTGTIADFPGRKNGGHTTNDVEVCALCPTHMKAYQKHISECTCTVADCDQYGTCLSTTTGEKRVCPDHAKKIDPHQGRTG